KCHPQSSFSLPQDAKRTIANALSIGKAEPHETVARINRSGHLTAYVWPRPSLLRCQRDQVNLLDPARSADPKHPGQLERRTDRGSPGGPIRSEGRKAEPRRDALGARAVLGKRHQGRVREYQRDGREHRNEAGLSRSVRPAALPDSVRLLLRMEKAGQRPG